MRADSYGLPAAGIHGQSAVGLISMAFVPMCSGLIFLF